LSQLDVILVEMTHTHAHTANLIVGSLLKDFRHVP